MKTFHGVAVAQPVRNEEISILGLDRVGQGNEVHVI